MAGKRRLWLRVILISLLILIIIGSAGVWKVYQMAFRPNTVVSNEEKAYLYIPSGSNFEYVKETLFSNGWIKNKSSFEFLAERKNYTSNVKAGRYHIRNGMSNNALINMLRAGLQDPVKLIFNNIRTREQLAAKVASQIEADSLEILKAIDDPEILEELELNKTNVMVIFFPDTYEFFWNTTADKFVDKMASEYKKFWTEERKAKADKAGLKPWEVSVLASIVFEETKKRDEMSRVAGVYINRLNTNMLLQADPTLKFAWKDFSIKRLYDYHKEIKSPYNTYKNIGLPPGPICLPDKGVVEKVLNYEEHQYYYFCARDDFSGYHHFSKSYNQHLVYARAYHRKLNQVGIR